MKIGILETGVAPPALAERYGRYDAMTACLLGRGFETTTFRAHEGRLPEDVGAFAGYVVPGSSAGAYEAHGWIPPLEEFLRAARGRARLVGICFGHQVMAQAFGGRVEKSGKGWGLGLQTYRVAARPAWLDAADTVAIPASHQDQVVAAPPGAEVLVGSDFAPLAGLVYADGSAMSVQGHPEFTPAFAKALLASRHDGRLPPDELARLAAGLDAPNDCGRIGASMARFLRGEGDPRPA